MFERRQNMIICMTIVSYTKLHDQLIYCRLNGHLCEQSNSCIHECSNFQSGKPFQSKRTSLTGEISSNCSLSDRFRNPSAQPREERGPTTHIDISAIKALFWKKKKQRQFLHGKIGWLFIHLKGQRSEIIEHFYSHLEFLFIFFRLGLWWVQNYRCIY